MSFDSNPDPGRTLGQFGIAVLALVVGAALLFLAIDRFSDDPVASPQPEPSATASVAPSDSPTAAATEEPAPSPSPAATEESPPPASPSPAATESESGSTEDPSPSESPTDDTDDGDDADRIDPGEISIQVLDAIKDGGDRAQEIADEMESDGYRVVAFNPSSIVYDETTVFYTDGYEDEANQVADDYGWDEIVFNDILSEDVNVHVVVGLDEQ